MARNTGEDAFELAIAKALAIAGSYVAPETLDATSSLASTDLVGMTQSVNRVEGAAGTTVKEGLKGKPKVLKPIPMFGPNGPLQPGYSIVGRGGYTKSRRATTSSTTSRRDLHGIVGGVGGNSKPGTLREASNHFSVPSSNESPNEGSVTNSASVEWNRNSLQSQQSNRHPPDAAMVPVHMQAVTIAGHKNTVVLTLLKPKNRDPHHSSKPSSSLSKSTRPIQDNNKISSVGHSNPPSYECQSTFNNRRSSLPQQYLKPVLIDGTKLTFSTRTGSMAEGKLMCCDTVYYTVCCDTVYYIVILCIIQCVVILCTIQCVVILCTIL